MTTEGNGQPVRFKVDLSGLIAQQINDLKKEAQLKGLAQDVTKALAMIIGRLQVDPLNFGELVSSFAHLNMIVHVAVVPPLVVRFAIHQDAHVVIIMQVRFTF